MITYGRYSHLFVHNFTTLTSVCDFFYLLLSANFSHLRKMMYAALLMASFKTLTVRSADDPGIKIEAIQKFLDLRSDAQIFVANINILST